MSWLAASVLVLSFSVVELVGGVRERAVQSPWELMTVVTKERIIPLIPCL